MKNQEENFSAEQDYLERRILAVVLVVENQTESKKWTGMPLDAIEIAVLTHHTAHEVWRYMELERLHQFLSTTLRNLKKGQQSEQRQALYRSYELLGPRLQAALLVQGELAHRLQLELFKREISDTVPEELEALVKKYSVQAAQYGQLQNVRMQSFKHECMTLCIKQLAFLNSQK